MDHLTRDGVSLFFHDVGGGAPPLLLVHGFGGEHTSLAPQLEHFRSRHRVIAVDLRGHGRSDKPRQDYTIVTFADDLNWLCYELGVYRPMIIGCGLGGMIALEVAARYRELPAAIAILDAAIMSPTGSLDVHRSLREERRGNRPSNDGARGFLQLPDLPHDKPASEDEVLPAAGMLPAHVAESVLRHAVMWDSVGAAAACQLPVLYIDAGTPNADLARLRELCPRLTIGRTVGAGHFPQLEVPEQVNAMIERFIAIALPGGTGSE